MALTSSAGNTRGLIEATLYDLADGRACRRGLPRGIPAASLKLVEWVSAGEPLRASSAGNTRGLIEASSHMNGTARTRRVFRGEYPRPH